MKLRELSDRELSRWIAEKIWHGSSYEPDMIHDPVMTVMLLQKMNADDDRYLKILGCVHGMWNVQWGPWESDSEVLGRAVGEAFMKGID